MEHQLLNFGGYRLNAPDVKQILFINQRMDPKLDAFFESHHEECRQLFDQRGYDFIYAPKVYTPEFCWELLTYNFPEMPPSILEGRLRNHSLNYILDYPVRYLYDAFTIVGGQTGKYLTGLVSPIVNDSKYIGDNYPELCDYQQSGTRQLLFFPLEHSTDEEVFAQLEEIIEWKWANDPEQSHTLYSKIGWTADMDFPEGAYKLVDEIRERVDMLHGMGVNEMMLKRILTTLPGTFGRLVITADFRILLPDFEKEIELYPLPKTVFLFFLRHAEGVCFKDLPDHKAEILRIYQRLMGDRYDASMEESIDKLTNPFNNSINEKCSRIREAFLKEMDESMAQYYFVTGGRGTPKSIKLPRTYLHWEVNL